MLTKIRYAGVVPLPMLRVVNEVDSEAIHYIDRDQDIAVLESHLVAEKWDAVFILAKKIVDCQRRSRKLRDDTLPPNIRGLIKRVHGEQFYYDGRTAALSRLEKYVARGDYATAIYQAKEIIAFQANVRSQQVAQLEAVVVTDAQIRISVVLAEIGSAIFDLAAHPGAILRLGLSVKHLAGTFEMDGVAQQRGLGDLLDAVKNAREEARLN